MKWKISANQLLKELPLNFCLVTRKPHFVLYRNKYIGTFFVVIVKVGKELKCRYLDFTIIKIAVSTDVVLLENPIFKTQYIKSGHYIHH